LEVGGSRRQAMPNLVRSDQTGREGLVLATTLVDLPAEQVVLIYECRWQIELFFRFLKQGGPDSPSL
jgi:IS4 transposase